MSLASVPLYKSDYTAIGTPDYLTPQAGQDKNAKKTGQDEIEKPPLEDTYQPAIEENSETYSSTGRTSYSENIEKSAEESQTEPETSETKEESGDAVAGYDTKKKDEKDKNSRAQDDSGLSSEEARTLQKLKARDIEVKAHERAHIAAGGQYVNGGAEFEYKTGPDGKRYAIGGEVSIDISKVPNNPEATIQKMRVVRNSALAPVNPSQQDRAVASQATRNEMEAVAELAQTEHIEKNLGSPKQDMESGDDSNKYTPTEPNSLKGSSIDIII